MSAGIEYDVKIAATKKLITDEIKKKKKAAVAKAKEEKQKAKLEELQRQSDTIIYNQNAETLDNYFYKMYANYLYEYEVKCQQLDIKNATETNEESYAENYEQFQLQRQQLEYEKNEKITGLYSAYASIIQKYLEYEIKYIDKQKTYDDKYKDFQRAAESKAKKLCKQIIADQYRIRQQYIAQLSAQNLLQRQLDIERKQLADIPKMMEDVISNIKTMFDAMVGREDIDLDNADIDIEKSLIAPINALIKPFLAAFSPMTALIPKLPIIGDIPKMLQTLTQDNGSTGLTEDDLKNAGKVEIPSDTQFKIDDIMNNILIVFATLPMAFINIIFQMVDVIYSKLKIIAKTIGLGSLFPLNLIDAAGTALSKCTSMMTGSFGMIKDLITYMVQKAELQKMILSRPTLPSAISSISLTPNMGDGAPDEVFDYDDVNFNMLSTCLSDIGFSDDKSLSSMKFNQLYTQYDLNKILENYKQIHNGTNTTVNYYYIQEGTKDTLKTESILRNQPYPCPEGYQEYLNGIISDSKKHLSSSLNYQRYATTEELIGATNYNRYKDFIDEKNKNVVIQSDIAANGKFRLIIPEFREADF